MNPAEYAKITDVSVLDQQIAWSGNAYKLSPNSIWSKENWRIGDELKMVQGPMSHKYSCLENMRSNVQLHFTLLLKKCPQGKLPEKKVWNGKVRELKQTTSGKATVVNICTFQGGQFNITIPSQSIHLLPKPKQDIEVMAHLGKGEENTEYTKFTLKYAQQIQSELVIDRQMLEKSARGALLQSIRDVNGTK